MNVPLAAVMSSDVPEAGQESSIFYLDTAFEDLRGRGGLTLRAVLASFGAEFYPAFATYLGLPRTDLIPDHGENQYRTQLWATSKYPLEPIVLYKILSTVVEGSSKRGSE